MHRSTHREREFRSHIFLLWSADLADSAGQASITPTVATGLEAEPAFGSFSIYESRRLSFAEFCHRAAISICNTGPSYGEYLDFWRPEVAIKPLSTLEIAALYAQGLSSEAIATRLGFGRNTVLRLLRQIGIVRSLSESRKLRTRSPRYREDVLNTTLTELYQSGMGIAAIAQQLGCHPTTVARRLKSTGTKLRRQGAACSQFSTLQMVSLYIEGLTAREIAEKLGCKRSTVAGRLHRAGISRRFLSHSLQSKTAQEP